MADTMNIANENGITETVAPITTLSLTSIKDAIKYDKLPKVMEMFKSNPEMFYLSNMTSSDPIALLFIVAIVRDRLEMLWFLIAVNYLHDKDEDSETKKMQLENISLKWIKTQLQLGDFETFTNIQHYIINVIGAKYEYGLCDMIFNACSSGSLQTFMWLWKYLSPKILRYETYPDTGKSAELFTDFTIYYNDYKCTFNASTLIHEIVCVACCNGKLPIVKWLFMKCGARVRIEVIESLKDGKILKSVCDECSDNGVIMQNMMEYIFRLCPQLIYNKEVISCAMWGLCVNNNLRCVKIIHDKLLTLEPHHRINYSELEEHIFRSACEYGSINVAKWLLKVKPDIDVSAMNHYAFRFACAEGHLDIAQWLYGLYQVDITAEGDFAFSGACESNFVAVAKWLQSLCPERYELHVVVDLDENETICQSWKINRYLTLIHVDGEAAKDKLCEIKKEKGESELCCPICYESGSRVNVMTNCSHMYCLHCIQQWYEEHAQNECPCCRKQLEYIIQYNPCCCAPCTV